MDWSDVAASEATYGEKADHLAFKVTLKFLAEHMDEEARKVYGWHKTHGDPERDDLFLKLFFKKYCNPFGSGDPVAWKCENVSACATALMRQVYEAKHRGKSTNYHTPPLFSRGCDSDDF
jgi:hypothetical protein